jgi:hypothetical protein
MALSEADLRRAREVAAQAPPPGPELLSRIRAILTGCTPAAVPLPAAPGEQGQQGDAADAA